MSLSPLDVREVEFALARRGYDEKQVDDFLDLVVLALEERDAALAAAGGAAPPAQQPAAAPGPQADVPQPTVVDLFALAHQTAEAHVAAAQVAAEELVTKAQQEAAHTLATAQREAVRVRTEAQIEHAAAVEELSRERDRLERRVEELQQLVSSSRAELEAYLTHVFQAVREPGTSSPHAVPLSA